MHERGNPRFFAALMCLLLVSPCLLADSFRCGTNLIREGMPAAEVMEKCGGPDSVEAVSEPIMARRPNGSTYQVGIATTEYWTYDRGSGRFPARLTIKEGAVSEIELLSRN
jgi:Protein of unknown function (DUF2845)